LREKKPIKARRFLFRGYFGGSEGSKGSGYPIDFLLGSRYRFADSELKLLCGLRG
jgi:hypothetical protein